MDGSNSGRWELDSTGGVNKLRPNSTNPGSITTIFINVDSLYGDYTDWVDSIRILISSGNLPILQIYEVGDNSIFGIYEVNSVSSPDRTGDVTITLTVVSFNGTFTLGREMSVSWIANGAPGMDGSNSGRWLLRGISIGTALTTTFYTNSATPTSVTSIRVHETSLNGSYGNWLTALENLLNLGNSPILQIYKVGSFNVFGIYEVTSITITLDRGGNPVSADITTTSIVGGGTFTALENYTISWVVNGATGTTGPIGPTGPAISIVQVTGITVSNTGWTASGVIFEYDILDANIGASSIVDVIPANVDYSTVVAAQLLPANISSSGQVKIFANNLPSADFGVTINIFN